MSYYVTMMQHRKPHQLTWEDVINDKIVFNDFTQDKSYSTSTITRVYDEIPEQILDKINVERMISWLKRFNEENKELHEKDKESLYNHFKIPKTSGGFRQIDAPCDELQSQLRRLSEFISEIGVSYHTSVFSYIKDRCITDCLKRHQKNQSNWYLKTDISGFFPSTTIDFVMSMAKMVFPLSEICKSEEGFNELKKALSLGFLNGGLPQGTALSPSITTWMYIPIDYKLFNEFAKRNMVYTRYADDMHISAKDHFPKNEAVKLIRETLNEFNAPHYLKREKTHYGSVLGQNWCLGLMCTAYKYDYKQNTHTEDYQITVGYRAKREFKAALCSFILDSKNGKRWEIEDVYHLRGLLAYYSMVEKEYFDNIVKTAENKWNVKVNEMFKKYLNGTMIA